MAQKTDCYVDTSALIAFLDKSDFYHPLFRRLFSAPPPLRTSALVITEGHGWFLRRYNQQRAIQFLAFIDALPRLVVERFDRDGLTRVAEVVKKYSDQPLTLADAHGIAVMKDRRISVCWSTDRHLTLGGASLVIQSS